MTSTKELQELKILVLKNDKYDPKQKLNLTRSLYENLHEKGVKYKNGIKSAKLPFQTLPHSHKPEFEKELVLDIESDPVKPKGDLNPIFIPPRNQHVPLHRTPNPFRKYFDVPSLFRARTRFFLMILVLLCLASVWSNILCFNFAVICISPHEEGQEKHEPSTTTSRIGLEDLKNGHNHEKEEHEKHESLLRPPITMAVAIGALIANFPAVYLANRYGIRIIFPIFGFISAISTGLMPTAIYWGFEYAIAARVLQGIAFACNFPAIGTFTSRWTYYKQSGLFVSTLVAFVQFSPIITNPVSGALCTSSLGWQSVFYGHAMVCAVLFLLFLIFYRNTPVAESAKIARGKSTRLKEAMRNIPYGAILKTMSVWAVWIAAVGNFFCVNLVFLYQPTYLHKVLGFGVGETGVTAALPPLLQFGLKLAAGFISDKIHFLKETTKVKMFNSIAFFGTAILLVVLAYINPENSTLAFIVLVAAEGCLGISTGGFFKTSAMVSRHFSHFVTGNIALSINSTILIVSFMVSGIASDNTPEQWSAIFIITACVLVWTNLFFICVGSAKPATWTYDGVGSTYSETASPPSSVAITPSFSQGGVSPKPILRHSRSDSEVIGTVSKSVGWHNDRVYTKNSEGRGVRRRNSMKNILEMDF